MVAGNVEDKKGDGDNMKIMYVQGSVTQRVSYSLAHARET